jgi:dTDP-4-amino-4,6-dideoxygalactose transaminase
MRWQVPLADVRMTEEDVEAVAATLRSGWLSMGPRTAEFEEAFAARVETTHAAAVSSGTAALHLMCLAAGIGPGDEVVVPSLTFVATVNAVRYTGATPVFADTAGPLEPWLSSAGCEAVLGPRTRAILHVAFGGHPGEITAIADLAERHGLLLLHDAAHAIGTRAGGRSLASFGQAAAYSFFSNKNLAIGEGGMVATNDDGIAERVRRLRSHGMTTLSWDRHRGHATEYDVVALGFNYRIDEPRAALGTSRLRHLPQEDALRRQLDVRYRDALDGVVDCALPPADGVQAAHHLFPIVLPADVDRAAFRAALAEKRIQTSVHYPPVHGFSTYHDAAVRLPVTEDYARRTVTLPLFAHLTHADQDLVVDATISALRRS